MSETLNNNPLVTILSPCYNVDAYLPQCLDSIINQTYTNLQIVLIDDGSQDNTWEILQDYSSRDSRIEIYHQANQGVATTRNNLLDKVKGDYVLFVDSDDWIELDMVEYLVTQVAAYKSEMITCQKVSEHTTDLLSYPIVQLDKESAIKEFLKHTTFNGSLWNKLIKASLLNDIRFRTNIWYGEDALVVWQVLQNIERVIVSQKPLYNYRVNEGSISCQTWTPEKKGSGHEVWRQITEDTVQSWPQYADIAQARYAIEDMWGLYYASLANYPYDEHIRERQLNVRKNLGLIQKSGLVSRNKIVTAFALGYCYSLGKILKFFG